AVAFGLAQRGAELVLLGRSAERCERVRQELAAATGRPPEVVLCDLASRREIERAAGELLGAGRPLHALVNNAGLVSLARRESADGVELTFAVNYLAMFQLTLRLLPLLVAGAPSRIVNVSSDTHRIARLDLDDLELRREARDRSLHARARAAPRGERRHLQRRRPGAGRVEHRPRQPRARLPARRATDPHALPEPRAGRAARDRARRVARPRGPQRRVLAPRPRAAPHPEGRGGPRAPPAGAPRNADRRPPLRARPGPSPRAGDGGEPMPRAEAEIAIEAPIELVWRVMLDLGAYARWNPFIVRIDPPGAGPARVGDDLVLHVRWRSGLAVRTRERITRLE